MVLLCVLRERLEELVVGLHPLDVGLVRPNGSALVNWLNRSPTYPCTP